MTPIIEAHGVKKRFGDVQALDGLDLVAESGHVTALLGPNGAGKTTFVSAVATLLRPDSGEIRVAGIDVCRDPKRVRETIALAGQYASVEPAMTGSENLQMVARLFGEFTGTDGGSPGQPGDGHGQFLRRLLSGRRDWARSLRCCRRSPLSRQARWKELCDLRRDEWTRPCASLGSGSSSDN